MFKSIVQQIKPAIILLLAFMMLIGFGYTGMITILAEVFFPHKAHGSLIEQNGKLIGSELMGQYFSAPKYFWGRPSATMPKPYNTLAATASNLGPTNPKLLGVIQQRITELKKIDPTNQILVPVDLVAASGSGVDPEISPYAAYYQVHRVAKARHLSDAAVLKILTAYIQKRQFGFLGEPRINVLQLNMAMDKAYAR